MKKERLNIGFLVDDLDMGLTAAIIQGASLAADTLDANLFLFPGKYLKPDYQDKKMTIYNYQFNTIFSYAGVTHLDILFVLLGTIASTRSKEEQQQFLAALGDTPIITLCCDVDGYLSLVFDNMSGFYQEIEHLITEHHVQKIGFVGGPETNDDAILRESIFREVLKKHHIPLPESYITHGNFTDYCTPAIEDFLDHNEDFEALVFANDSMAVAGYQVLEQRGYTIGKDILVVGFDDDTFAVSMIPPLTTVKNNGTDLGYNAVMSGEEFLRTGHFNNKPIPSSVIIRKSCGCSEPNGADIAKRLGVQHTKTFDFEQQLNALLEYLFSERLATLDEVHAATLFSEFITMFLTGNAATFHEHEQDITKKYAELFANNILQFTTSDRIFDVLRYLHFLLEADKSYNPIALSDLFYHLYRFTSEKIICINAKNQEELTQLNHRINSFTREMITFDETIDISYETIAETLKGMKMPCSYLYVFDQPLSHKENDDWQLPEYVYLHAYHTDKGIFSIPKKEQKIPVSSILFNKYTQTDHRVTRILAPLFSNELQYGVLLCELEQKYHQFLTPSISQLSAVIRTLFMLEEQRKIESELTGNLKIAIESNEYLENISKIDELSKVYNRRGFYEHMQNLITQPELQGTSALLLFGDLDRLKLINDQYGHDAGDVAIRTVAEILTEAFGETGIVARFGGDEFVSLIFTSQNEFEQTLLPAFSHLKQSANEQLKLPYQIDISIGYTEFILRSDIELSKLLEDADAKLYEEKIRKKTLRTE